MATLTFAKSKSSLRPVGDAAWDALCKLADGQEVLIDVKARRNVRRHRLAWALANVIYSNTEIFPSVECAMDAIKIGTGHLETWIDPETAVIQQRAKSIAFHSMEEIDFAQFLDRAVSLICGRWLSGTEDRVLLAKVNAILDGPDQSRRAA